MHRDASPRDSTGMHLRRRCGLWLLLAIAELGAGQAHAQAPPVPSETLRERVERIRDDPTELVRGASIAARRVLPELYANRGFSPAWTSPEARAELLRAIRDSAADGLDPRDYHLAVLEDLAADMAGS